MKIASGAAAIAILAFLTPAIAQRQRGVTSLAGARVEVESAQIDFGPAGDLQKELPSAITVRVFSPRSWALRVLPVSSLTEHEHGQTVGWDRLAWRTRSGGYQPLLPAGSVVARGRQTGPGGELVLVDLRIVFGGSDPLGHFGGTLKIVLDTW